MPCPDCKRKSAEVLAACITKAKQHRNWAKQSMEPDGEARAQEIVDALSMLQPAASYLEAWLREAREKGRQQERENTLLDVLAFNSGIGCTPQEGYRDLADALRDTKHLSLEKARAEGKG